MQTGFTIKVTLQARVVRSLRWGHFAGVIGFRGRVTLQGQVARSRGGVMLKGQVARSRTGWGHGGLGRGQVA